MGNVINFCTLPGVLDEKSYRVVMLGIDNAGKTTILYNLKNPTSLTNIPDVYNNVVYNHESIPYTTLYGSSILHLWDVGGKPGMRPLWKNYIEGMNAIIYVIDASDHARLEETREELYVLMKSGVLSNNTVMLIYANKVDYRGCMKSQDIIKRLELEKFSGVQWHVQESVGMTGQGLYQGLDWLLNALAGDDNQTVTEEN